MASGTLRGTGWPRDQAGRDGCLSSSAYARGSPKPAGWLVTLDRGVTYLTETFIRFGGVRVCVTGTREVKRSGQVVFCPLQT